MSSTLLRAVQTAYYLFPKNNIFVSPYIGELGHGVDNQAIRPIKQREKMMKNDRAYYKYSVDNREFHPTNFLPERVKYTFVDRGVRNKIPNTVKWENAQKPDYNKFIEWLDSAIQVFRMANIINKNKKEITIAVVGHSGFMAKNIKTELQGKPFNVGMVELNFCYKKLPPNRTRVEHGLRLTRELFKVDQKSCNCPLIPTLKGVDGYRLHRRVSKLCNGVVFHGYPAPSKEQFGEGGENCNI